jgi:hypothetical protein
VLCLLFSLFGNGAAGRRWATERGRSTLQAAKRGGVSARVTGRRRWRVKEWRAHAPTKKATSKGHGVPSCPKQQTEPGGARRYQRVTGIRQSGTQAVRHEKMAHSASATAMRHA